MPFTPEAFIIGAQRAGTISLCAVLSQHANIVPSRVLSGQLAQTHGAVNNFDAQKADHNLTVDQYRQKWGLP